jgi:hypothetical protein
MKHPRWCRISAAVAAGWFSSFEDAAKIWFMLKV